MVGRERFGIVPRSCLSLCHVHFHLMTGADGVFANAGVFIVLRCLTEGGDDIHAEDVFEDIDNRSPDGGFLIVEFFEKGFDEASLELHGPGGPDGAETFGTDGMFDFLAELIDEVGIDFLHESAGPDADIGIVFIEDVEKSLEVEVLQFLAGSFTNLEERAIETFDQHLEGVGDFADAKLGGGPSLDIFFTGLDTVEDEFLDEFGIDL